MKSSVKEHQPLRDYLDTIPVIDCHDHTQHVRPNYPDAVHALFNNYIVDELTSATSEKTVERILNTSLALEERWPLLEKAWQRTCYTGYAKPVKRVLKHFYGQDSLSLDALMHVQNHLLNLQDDDVFQSILDQANIVIRLEDICFFEPGEIRFLLDGTYKVPPRSLPVISLPWFHQINSYETVQTLTSNTGRVVTSLDEYLQTCREIFEGYKRIGAAAFKDQSAYKRTLRYENPCRADAEKIFNWFMEDPRRIAAYPDGVRPLDDYLFHEFMRMARDMNLPVQIHTGHMAGIRNDITKANAIEFTSVLELHREVRFDLFHVNWPYSGELLFLAKNYPNVSVNFCWTHIIDPVYCRNLIKQMVSCIPHAKVHAFGADFAGNAEFAWAHAEIAKDNIALALAEMIETDDINPDDARHIARAWFYENPKEFYRLGGLLKE